MEITWPMFWIVLVATGIMVLITWGKIGKEK